MVHRDAQGQAEATPRDTVPAFFRFVFVVLSPVSPNSIE